MQLLLGVFSAFGLSASAGLNAYIPLLTVGIMAHYFPATLKLSQPWDLIANPWILILLGVLVVVEMLADKIPAVNHVNDIIQTVIRPAAGAIAFAASAKVITDVHPVVALACGLLIAGGVHAVKAVAVRPMVTATTGGAGNVPVSIVEDIAATGVSILAIVLPIAMVIALLAFSILLARWLSYRKEQTA
jgi:hypothetical protein